jgi:RNAse (barnase) inhibitor barstar
VTETSATFRLVNEVRDTLTGRLLLRQGVTSVAVLDALELTSDYAVFEALNEQFRFPAYFGWNWDALYDCLADLSWLPADRYFVVIENADALETESGRPHGLLIYTLRRAAQTFLPESLGRREPAEFTVLMLRGGDDEALAARLRGSGVVLDESWDSD